MTDLIILGAGPAGLTASIYASRYKIDHIVIGSVFNSSVSRAYLIENWPGEQSIKGYDLLAKFYEHAKTLGGNIIQEEVVEIKKKTVLKNSLSSFSKNVFSVKTRANKTYEARSLLITLGTSHKKLNIPGESEFLGKGVSYCAVCDGALFKGKAVAVVGGSSSAAMSAGMLTEHADKVYIIYRGERLRCEPIVLENLEKNSKVEIIYKTNVTKILGEKKSNI